MRAVLSIGSNLDDRVALLRSVFDDFAGELVGASAVYATPPWGDEDQGEFLNAILIVDTDLSPVELLHRGQGLEQAAQRRRVRHWGPRTLDVDIVNIPGFTSHTQELTVPHPYAQHRAFVLVPWLDVDPNATLSGRRVSDLVASLDAAEVAGLRRLGRIEQL